MSATTLKSHSECFADLVGYAETAPSADLSPAGRAVVVDRLSVIQGEHDRGDSVTWSAMAAARQSGQDAWGVLCDFGLLDE